MTDITVYFAPNGMALGHAGRCIPIAKEIERRGDKAYFSTYGDAINFLKRCGYPVICCHELKIEETPEGEIALKETSLKWPLYIFTFIRQVKAEICNLKKIKPEVIVSDSRLSPLFAGKLLGIPRILLLHQIRMLIPHRQELGHIQKQLKKAGEEFIMYSTRFYWKSSNIILVPDFPPPYTIAKENLLTVPKKMLDDVEFIGQIISKKPEELPSKEEIKKKMGLDDRPVIYAGVAGTTMEKKKFNKLLTDILTKFPDKYQIIMTRGIPDIPDRPVYKNKNITIYNWVSDRYSILKTADIVISKAGHNTIAECFYYGKPMVLVPTPAHSEHQGNAKAVYKMGVARVIQQRELTYETLLSNIEYVLNDSNTNNKIKRIQKFVSKINAVQAVIDKIDYYANK
ncbi:MAG: glycosyltransferase [Candidatus Odinarchaeia archaeon]